MRRLSASLTLKLVLLVGVFIALPIVLYGQFENADRATRELVTRAIQHRSGLVAEALRPMLEARKAAPPAALGAALRRFADDGTTLQLMMRPAASADGEFVYVASAPESGAGALGAQLDSLQKHGILQKLAQSCSWDQQQEFRYARPGGAEEVLTSLIPILTDRGCWVLVSSHATTDYLDSSLGRPYWRTREVRVAALIYLGLAGLAMLTALSVRRNLRHFRDVAREIRGGRVGERSFAAENLLPELSSVAEDFDMLVRDLQDVAREIRQTAEDNAHSFKGPIATIQASLEPVRRLVPQDNQRASRALSLIDAALERLKSQVAAAQMLDNNTADLIAAPRPRVDLTRMVAEILSSYREVMAERQVTLKRALDKDVIVRAGAGVLELVIENILDNAISLSPPGGTVTVALVKGRKQSELLIEDEGPGIEASRIERVFERYHSLRPPSQAEEGEGDAHGEPDHSGLGLWIVRRNVEALGGRVSLANRPQGGLSVRVTLPANGKANA